MKVGFVSLALGILCICTGDYHQVATLTVSIAMMFLLYRIKEPETYKKPDITTIPTQ